jgi:hypothetical protein
MNKNIKSITLHKKLPELRYRYDGVLQPRLQQRCCYFVEYKRPEWKSLTGDVISEYIYGWIDVPSFTSADIMEEISEFFGWETIVYK